MSALILVAPGQPDLWRKLAEIQKIDPTISGGIDSIVYGRTQQRRGTPIPTLFSSGYEEIHEIEPGLCAHITDAVIDPYARVHEVTGEPPSVATVRERQTAPAPQETEATPARRETDG